MRLSRHIVCLRIWLVYIAMTISFLEDWLTIFSSKQTMSNSEIYGQSYKEIIFRRLQKCSHCGTNSYITHSYLNIARENDSWSTSWFWPSYSVSLVDPRSWNQLIQYLEQARQTFLCEFLNPLNLEWRLLFIISSHIITIW